MKFKLAQKILLLVEMMVVGFTIVGGVITYFVFQRSITDKLFAHLESVSALKEQSISNFIEEATTEVVYLERGSRTNSKMVEYLQSKEKSKELKASIAEDLLDISKEKNILSNIFILDAEGVVEISTSLEDEGKIRADNSYYQKAKDKTVVETFTYDMATKLPTLIIATPIKDENDQFLGMLVGHISIEAISNLMTERSGLGVTGETFIVNSANVVVTELLKEPNTSLKKTIFLPQVVKCLAGTSNYGNNIDYHGDKVFGYWRFIPDINSCLIVKMDRSEAFVSIATSEIILAVSMLGLSLIVGILGYFISRSITRPLAVLQGRAEAIASGKYDQEIKIKSGDEIGDLAKTFNEMTIKLKESYAGLEERVKTQTKELNHKLSELDAKNAQMTKSEMAVINILEDEKELEKQLEIEKKGVEQKVEERTRELEAEEAKLMASISALPGALLIVDANNKIVTQNDRVEKIFGKISGELDLATIDNKLGDQIELREKISQAIKEKKTFDVEEISYGKKYLRMYIAPVVGRDTILIGVVIMIDDVTEARTLSRSRDEFFSIASHELRTPLTAIRGNTSMMLDYYKEIFKDPELKQMIDDTHEASVRLIGIVNDFLDMSRLEMGKVEYKIEEVKVALIIKKIVSDLEGTVKAKGLAIEFEGEESLIAKTDANKLEQILFNLIGNSIKFTDQGKIVVQVDKVADEVSIEVSDTGKGIAIENQALLFHKFQQAGKSLMTRAAAKGTGLGLYISRLMAEGMNGKLELVKSEEGQGSTFRLSLPYGGL
ncbi:MAG: ATP-binding protein [bacterium]